MNDDIIHEFLAESWENLGQLDAEIVTLEKQPQNQDLLASIFRTIHTIKGTCGFLGLNNLGSVAHSAENVLGKMRDGVLAVTQESISTVLRGIDVIKELLQSLEKTGEEATTDHSALIAELDRIAEGGEAVSTPPVVEEEQAPAQTIAEPEPVKVDAPVESAVSKPAPTPAASQEEAPVESNRSTTADLSIRVNVNVLDSLMNLVGELVLARNQLLQLARGDDESKYAAPITHLNRVTTDLQEGVMKTRMQPIGHAWGKLPRLVRDLSQVTGKHIELEVSGSETELDRTVLDAIKDPLTHMVRNSADHGIESAERRLAAGKPEHGTIRLNAFHEGGHVIISIEDDGGGINTERVLRKAIEKGLVAEADAEKMSHRDILALIFRAGFSTAETVSSVSGRGVGMDVVRTEIERIGGTIELNSVAGKGTSIRIKIPLTLAIISALVVEAGGLSFAIPQLGVVELVRLAAEDAKKIERINKNEVFRLRDRLLPLVQLDCVLSLNDSKPNDSEPTNEANDVNIVVVQVGEDQLGLIVSEVFDTEEIVVKPVGRLLKDVPIYQGTTILGDGRVIMILDIGGIASDIMGTSTTETERERSTETEQDTQGDVTSLLLFDAGNGRTMAVPLSLVARLEEFPQKNIEHSGDMQVVQYRGDLLPLQPVAGVSSGGEWPDPQPVIVFTEGTKSMGLMVNEIKDILEERLILRMQSDKSGVIGTAIINGEATDIIDTRHYVLQANPDWFRRHNAGPIPHVLLIDHSLFFRQLVQTSMNGRSIRLTTVDSAVNAIDLLEQGQRFDAVVCELDLPMMDGFEFADYFKAESATKNTPLIVLTSMTDGDNEARAMEAGFDRFLEKYDAKEFQAIIHELCRKPVVRKGMSA